jgi:glutathione S-transferase
MATTNTPDPTHFTPIMKIFYSPASPFVRKCMVVAHELGIAERIERLPSAAGPVKRDATILPTNPLGQVPTFLTDDGQALFDSRVICEYLNDQQRGTLFPASGKARCRAARALRERAASAGIPLGRLDRRPAREGAHRARMAREGSGWIRRTCGHRDHRLRLCAGVHGLPVSGCGLACSGASQC